MERERRDFLLWYFGCFSLWICLTLYGIPIWAAAGTFELLLPFHIWPRTNCLIRYVFAILFLASLPRTNYHFISELDLNSEKEKNDSKKKVLICRRRPTVSSFSFFFQVSVKCSVFLKERKKRKKDKTDKKEILLDTTSQLCSDLTCWPCFPIYTGWGRWPPATHPYQHPPAYYTTTTTTILYYSCTKIIRVRLPVLFSYFKL